MTLIAGLLRRVFDLDEKKDGSQPSVQGSPPSSSESRPPLESAADPRHAAPQGSVASARVLKQFGLLAGGVAFMGLSMAVSRRAVRRHAVVQRPLFYHVNRTVPLSEAEFKKNKREPLMALEALKLATLNVLAFGIALVGAVSVAMDVSTVDELRTRLRASMDRAGGEAAVDEAAERELAEWLVKYLKIDTEKLEEAARKDREGKGNNGEVGSGPAAKK